MEHEVHLNEDVDRGGMAFKIVALVVILAIFVGIGVYMVYGSGMWNPPSVTHPAI
jgi:hypothetical protein